MQRLAIAEIRNVNADHAESVRIAEKQFFDARHDTLQIEDKRRPRDDRDSLFPMYEGKTTIERCSRRPLARRGFLAEPKAMVRGG